MVGYRKTDLPTKNQEGFSFQTHECRESFCGRWRDSAIWDPSGLFSSLAEAAVISTSLREVCVESWDRSKIQVSRAHICALICKSSYKEYQNCVSHFEEKQRSDWLGIKGGSFIWRTPPQKIQTVGLQRAVVGVGTSKSDVGSGNGIHAIQSSSLAHVFQLLLTSSCPRRPGPHHQLSQCSYFSIFQFCQLKCWLFWVYFAWLFPICLPDVPISSLPAWKEATCTCAFECD